VAALSIARAAVDPAAMGGEYFGPDGRKESTGYTYAIGLYDAPRSIIDAFRLRHAAGPDIANEALRRWLRNGGKPADLMRLTRIFPAAKPALLHALQVLL
jgi:hypothetical protein